MRANNPIKLDSVAEIFVGAQTSADKIYVIDPTDESKTHVTFTDDRGNERMIERGILYPFLHDAQIVPFGTPKANKYIIWPYKKVDGAMTVLSEGEFQKNYPLTWDYLSGYAATLKKRSILGGNAKDRKWYQFGRAQSLNKFDSEKIIATVLSREPRYGYERDNVVISGGGNGPYYAIRPRPDSPYSIFFILAVLCHPLSEAIIRTKTSVFGGGYYSHGKQFLEELPVPKIDFASPDGVKEHNAVVDEVKKLIALTDSTKTAMTPGKYAVSSKQIEMMREALESRLNKIFGLTQAGYDVIRSVPIPE